MKKYSKAFFPVLVASALVIGVPYLKTPGSCGLTYPVAFTGAIFGCGGEKKPASQTNADGKTIAAAEKEKNTGIKVTFVEFGSENCVPCRMMKPVMEKIEKDYQGQVKVVFHDVWTPEGKSSGYKFAVRVIPTQVFFDKDGEEYFRHEGFFAFEEVDKILKQKGVK